MNILLLQNYIIRINKTLFRDVSEKRNEKRFYYTINSTVLVKIIQTLILILLTRNDQNKYSLQSFERLKIKNILPLITLLKTWLFPNLII